MDNPNPSTPAPAAGQSIDELIAQASAERNEALGHHYAATQMAEKADERVKLASQRLQALMAAKAASE